MRRGRERRDGEGSVGAQRARSPGEVREALLMYAFRALGQRALSEAELRARMLRRSEDAELVEGVLGRVRELGYLSDEQVALSEARRPGVGAGRVRQKLRQRGVAGALIEEVLEARDPEVEVLEARQLLARRWPGFLRAPDPKRRAFAFLVRRGYAPGLIWSLLKDMPEEGDVLEKDGEGWDGDPEE